MSAPPGFNPNASLLPDANAPIHVVQGGGGVANINSEFSSAEQEILAQYGLGPHGPLQNYPSEKKRAFLDQIETACKYKIGQTKIIDKKCWAVKDVIRELMSAAMDHEIAKNTQVGGRLYPSGKGIKNPKFCCYFISVLQILYSIGEFREFIENYSGDDEVLLAIQDVFNTLTVDPGARTGKGVAPHIKMDPTKYTKIVKCLQTNYEARINRIGRVTNNMEQGDAAEFISNCIFSKIEGEAVYGELVPFYEDPSYKGLLGFSIEGPDTLQGKIDALESSVTREIIGPEQKYVFIAINRNAGRGRDITPIIAEDRLRIGSLGGDRAEFELKAFIYHDELTNEINHFYSLIKDDDEWVEYNDDKVREPSEDVDSLKATSILYLYERVYGVGGGLTPALETKTAEEDIRGAYEMLGLDDDAEPESVQVQIEHFRAILDADEREPFEEAYEQIKEYLSQPKETRLRWLNQVNPEAAELKKEENSEALAKWQTSKYNPEVTVLTGGKRFTKSRKRNAPALRLRKSRKSRA